MSKKPKVTVEVGNDSIAVYGPYPLDEGTEATLTLNAPTGEEDFGEKPTVVRIGDKSKLLVEGVTREVAETICNCLRVFFEEDFKREGRYLYAYCWLDNPVCIWGPYRSELDVVKALGGAKPVVVPNCHPPSVTKHFGGKEKLAGCYECSDAGVFAVFRVSVLDFVA